MYIRELFALALSHANRMPAGHSAWYALMDAESAQTNGKDPDIIRYWLIRSLQYSCGILHPDYKKAIAK